MKSKASRIEIFLKHLPVPITRIISNPCIKRNTIEIDVESPEIADLLFSLMGVYVARAAKIVGAEKTILLVDGEANQEIELNVSLILENYYSKESQGNFNEALRAKHKTAPSPRGSQALKWS